MYKTSALDLSVKSTQLCKFLSEEKGENLISPKLFNALCQLSQACYAMDNPSLSKAETALLRKTASMEYYNANFCLDTLYISGYISQAQKESMVKTIDALKKQINF